MTSLQASVKLVCGHIDISGKIRRPPGTHRYDCGPSAHLLKVPRSQGKVEVSRGQGNTKVPRGQANIKLRITWSGQY